MDHIPCYYDGQHPDIPLWVSSNWVYNTTEIEELQQYPYLNGWDKNLFMKYDFTESSHKRSLEDMVEFLQQWLYFGGLATALSIPVRASDFEQRNSRGESKLLSTKNLGSFLTRWLHEVKCLSKQQRLPHLIRMNKVISLLKIMARAMWDCEHYKHRLPSALPLSLTILGITLGFVLPQSLGRANLDSDVRSSHIRLWAEDWYMGEDLKCRFKRLNWCPNDYFRLSKIMSISTLCYAATIRRSENVIHSQCVERECTANFIDENIYSTKHAGPDCRCEFIPSTSSSASAILAQGKIPLISLWAGTSENGEAILRMELIPSRGGQDYVAISHVWSDGLGNVRDNSLPRCQTLQLHALVLRLHESESSSTKINRPAAPVLLWIDTLCVPRERKYRNIAIRRMAETYENAAWVLVLDSELKQAYSENRPPHELLARISASGWMRRVWTLQEGVLASRLFVEFRDRIQDLSSLVCQMNARTNSLEIELDMVPVECMLAVGLLQSIRRSRSEDQCQCFINTWNSIKTRQTSRRGDELICFAHLIGLDVADLLYTDDTDWRMKTLFSMLPYVPRGLLYTAGPKLNTDGYRWAPQSIFTDERIDPTSTAVERDEKGLRIKAPGIFLSHQPECSFQHVGIYEGTIRPTGTRWFVRLSIVRAQGDEYDETVRNLARFRAGMAVIVDGTDFDTTSDAESCIQGALVLLHGEEEAQAKAENEAVPCSYKCCVEVTVIDEEQIRHDRLLGSCQKTDPPLHKTWYIS